MDPITNPQDWDTVDLGGVTTPGRCELSGFKREHDFDKKMGKGSAGATSTFVGKPPAQGSIEFFLWLPEHFVAWDALRPALKYDPSKGKQVEALAIYHPALWDLEIASVVTEKIGIIQHKGEQLYAFTVDFSEYLPPPKKSAVGNPQPKQWCTDPPGGMAGTGVPTNSWGIPQLQPDTAADTATKQTQAAADDAAAQAGT